MSIYCKPLARAKIDNSFSLRLFDGQCNFRELFDGPVPTFESNIVFVLRFMIDTKVVGMNWIEVPAGKYKVTSRDKKRSLCQLEITFRYVTLLGYN